MADLAFTRLLEKAAQLNLHKLEDRVFFFAKEFMSKPYLNGALGEGASGKFDQNPLYRADAFDCVTYVNTVLALAHANNLMEFQKNIVRLNYQNEKVDYLFRHHFMSVDWNITNEALGYIKNITPTICNNKNQSIHEIARACIDKPQWFLHRTMQDIKLQKTATAAQLQKLLQELHALASEVQAVVSEMPYLPFEKMFVGGVWNQTLLAQIPHGAIIEIVRPNWDLTDKIGTHLNISHLGFVFRNENKLIFCHASSLQQQVVTVALTDYLQECLKTPSIKGICILETL